MTYLPPWRARAAATPVCTLPATLALIYSLGGCANLPPSYDKVSWRDLHGDRGAQVAQRDLLWCLDAAESRRSLVGNCMAAHGWLLIE